MIPWEGVGMSFLWKAKKVLCSGVQTHHGFCSLWTSISTQSTSHRKLKFSLILFIVKNVLHQMVENELIYSSLAQISFFTQTHPNHVCMALWKTNSAEKKLHSPQKTISNLPHWKWYSMQLQKNWLIFFQFSLMKSS